ncbi:MAG: polymerase sigma factor SigI, partial [Paenibacillus sp.]|nr:polymerase sigma factor SigI [Paenibacillus sp.]
FAETVIRRRLIDNIRKESRFKGQIPNSSFEVEDEEDGIVNPVEVHQAIEQFEKEKTIQERQSEIVDFNRCLLEFGITFGDLVKVSPKHSDSRETLFAIGATLARDQTLMSIVLTKKLLPIKELLELVSVSRKTLERNRKFIMAVALIYCGPYPYLKDYLNIPAQDQGEG